MDPILQTLLSWQFVIFSMAIASIIFVIRKVAEYLMDNYASAAKESKLWNELILPILPVFLGSFGAYFFKSYPYPNGLTSSGSRIVFGLVAGLLSTLLYRVIKALLGQKMTAMVQTWTGNPNVNINVGGMPTEQIPPDQISRRGQI